MSDPAKDETKTSPVFTVQTPDGRPAQVLGLWLDPATRDTLAVVRPKGAGFYLEIYHPSKLVQRVEQDTA